MLTSVVQDRPFPDDEWEGKISLLAEEDAPLLMPLIRPKTGIVCVNDAAAIGVRNAFAPEGLVAGRDYGMVGFDDSPASLDAGITTLRPPLERLGRTAYDIASGHNSRQSSGERICHHSLLVRRTSSTPSRTQAIPPESG
jgi:DNA-binding LacI/PurR family transcriptional regulator